LSGWNPKREIDPNVIGLVNSEFWSDVSISPTNKRNIAMELMAHVILDLRKTLTDERNRQEDEFNTGVEYERKECERRGLY
jgi:hypothetical protein